MEASKQKLGEVHGAMAVDSARSQEDTMKTEPRHRHWDVVMLSPEEIETIERRRDARSPHLLAFEHSARTSPPQISLPSIRSLQPTSRETERPTIIPSQNSPEFPRPMALRRQSSTRSDDARFQASQQPGIAIDAPEENSDREYASSEVSSPERLSNPGHRAPRPPYSTEEEDCVRFYRDDLELKWKEVVSNFSHVAKQNGWDPRSESGLQSCYYRVVQKELGINVRRSPPKASRGILKTKNVRYWWMSTK